MKKLLVLSLGLILAGQQAQAMFARAVKTASQLSAGLAAGAGLFAGADSADKMAQDRALWRPTEQESQAIDRFVAYKQKIKTIAEEAAARHDVISKEEASGILDDVLAKRALLDQEHENSTQEFSKMLTSISKIPPFYWYVSLVNQLRSSFVGARKATEEEKQILIRILSKHGYSDDKASCLADKIYIAEREFNMKLLGLGAYYECFSDRVFVPKRYLLDEEYVTSYLDCYMKQSVHKTLMHELTHQRYARGHIGMGKLDSVFEEQRAELEALSICRKQSSELGRRLNPFIGSQNIWYHDKKDVIPLGYITASPWICTLFEDRMQKKEQEEFLALYDEVLEKARRVQDHEFEKDFREKEQRLERAE